jgi:hypothetical protein
MRFIQKHEGCEFEALFLERQKDGYQLAVLENQIPIDIEVQKDFCGEIKKVKVVQAKNGRLFGKAV